MKKKKKKKTTDPVLLYFDKKERKKRKARKARKAKKIEHMLKKYGKDILKSEKFQSSENNIQHGTMSVRRHCLSVASTSVRIAEKLKLNYSKKDLIRGALLHDYFLYDWHDEEHRQIRNLHGFYHPGVALRNAEKDYKLTKKQRDIIKKHMWPMTVVPPTCKEGWVVTMADKYCSLLETLHIMK